MKSVHFVLQFKSKVTRILHNSRCYVINRESNIDDVTHEWWGIFVACRNFNSKNIKILILIEKANLKKTSTFLCLKPLARHHHRHVGSSKTAFFNPKTFQSAAKMCFCIQSMIEFCMHERINWNLYAICHATVWFSLKKYQHTRVTYFDGLLAKFYFAVNFYRNSKFNKLSLALIASYPTHIAL